MADPRLNGNHLEFARQRLYDQAVDDCLDNRGPATAAADPFARAPAAPVESVRLDSLPPGGTYTLVSLPDGRRHPLRTGINTIGRMPENDLLLTPNPISRRHCVVLVHASGGCEVHDTASRNHVYVNGQRVDRVDLFPGDLLQLCDFRFLLAWVGPNGHCLPSEDARETSLIGGPGLTMA